MILGVLRLVKALVVPLLFYFFWKRCTSRNKSHAFFAGIMICLFAAAFLAQAISSSVPPMTDTVFITALGEKNKNAKSDEIRITGFTVDGKDYPLNSKTLKVLDGKWFWCGNSYCWRNGADIRQPEGTTRTVLLAVPVGWERSVSFENDENCGFVEISTGFLTQTVDTSVYNSADLGRSRMRDMVFNQLRDTLVFLSAIVIVAGGLLYITAYTDETAAWKRRKKWYLIYAGIAMLQLLHAIRYSGVVSFWIDEMYEIGWIESASSVFESMMADAVPRPIFGSFLYYWYKLVPYGERWLLLPMEIATAIGIYLCALCAKECKDEKAGAFAAAFAALSSNTLYQFSYEIRSYPFYFCFGAALLLLNLRRWKHPGRETTREIVKASIILTLFAGMHIYAVIICVLYFVIDVYRFIKFRIKLKCIIPYIIGAFSYIPVLFVVIRNIRTNSNSINDYLTNFWTSKPTLNSIASLIKYLCGSSYIIAFFLLLSITILLKQLYTYSIKTTFPDVDNRHKLDNMLYMIFVCSCLVFIMFCYGNLRPQSTLWSHRYFSGLFPITYTLSACGASLFCDWLGKKQESKLTSSITACFILITLFNYNYSELLPQKASIEKSFRESADFLYEQVDTIYNSDTIVVVPLPSYPVSGWDYYYMQQQGRRDPVHICSDGLMSSDELGPYNTVYIVALHTYNISEQMQSTLDTEFTCRQVRLDIPISEYERK